MPDVFITKASFKRIVKEREVSNDYQFTDTIVWNHKCGYVITEEQSWIFTRWEIRDLLMYKAFCVDIKEGVKSFYKKVEVRDSWRYTQAEQAPCYHADKNCAAMHSPYRAIYIPIQIRIRAEEKAKKEGHDAGQLIIDKYREFWRGLENEFKEKYGDDWRTTREHTEQFANRVNMRYELDPPIRSFDVEEKGNSGINDELFDNRSAQEISDSILGKIESLRRWASEDNRKCMYFNRYAKLSWLGNSTRPISNLWTGDSESEVKKVLKDIHLMKKEIMDELRELYMRLYIPDLKFDASLLKSIGFRPCYKCHDPFVICGNLSGYFELL